MPSHLRTFALNSAHNQLVGHGPGLRLLIGQLAGLLARTNDAGVDHEHLMSLAWAGDEPSEKAQGEIALNSVVTFCGKTTHARHEKANSADARPL